MTLACNPLQLDESLAEGVYKLFLVKIAYIYPLDM